MYLSVSAWIRVIDPFSQIKREYNTITLSHLKALHDALRETFLKKQKQVINKVGYGSNIFASKTNRTTVPYSPSFFLGFTRGCCH